MFEMRAETSGLLLVISGPAGSGKTTLCDRMLAAFPGIRRIVTATTRAPREGEVDGVDYHFLSMEAFEQGIRDGAFFEHALVHGRRYGTLMRAITEPMDSGFDLLLNIDVQGAASVRQLALANPLLRERFASIFIRPASLEVIRERLMFRSTDGNQEIERRIASAEVELKQADQFDYILPTRSRDEDFDAISSIYRAEKLRNRRLVQGDAGEA
jgi:guanylate kinase